MKLFSNFNTKLGEELYESSVEKYGSDNVLIVRRDPIFLWFKIIIPCIVWITILITILWIKNKYFGTMDYIIWLWLATIGMIITLIGMRKILIKLMDYYMDFCVITPVQILSYDQCGLLNRASRSLDLNSLKSIDIEKSWLTKSIFNYGTLIFFSEWDTTNISDETKMWTIRLNYIKHPSAVLSSIMDVVKYSQSSVRNQTKEPW